MYFSTLNRAQLKEENPEASFGELGKLVGEAWKKLSEDEKETYNRKALQDKQRYKTEMDNYSASDDDNDSDNNSDTKRSPKKAVTKDPHAPKGPKSAYILFLSETRDKIKTENPDLDFQGLAKKVGSEFKALSDTERSKWDDLAKQDKQRYLDEMEDYEPPKGFGKDGKKESSSGGAGGGGKKKKVKKDPDAPKRPMTAYFMYMNEQRPLIKQENPDIKFGEIAQVISKKFKALTEDQQEKYNKLASKDKERYKKEMAAYKSKKAAEEASAKDASDDDDDSDDDESKKDSDSNDSDDDLVVPSDDDDDSDDDDSDDDSD